MTFSPAEAVAVIQSDRQHPRWRILGFPPRIHDLRTALCLQAFGVTDFATANVKDVEDTGFANSWKPDRKLTKSGFRALVVHGDEDHHP